MIQQRRRMDATKPTTPVILGDGATWELPMPMVYTAPGKPSRTNLGVRFDELAKAVESAEWRWEQDAALINVGAFLVRKNFYVSDAELGVLLTFDPLAAKKILDDLRADGRPFGGNPFSYTAALIEELRRVAFGVAEDRTYDRWVHLSVLAAGRIPDLLPIADYNDLAGFLESMGRTISRRWVPEINREVLAQEAEKMLDSMF